MASRFSYSHERRRFMFATGIENSYPIITGRNGQDVRVDEMAKTKHYEHWRQDFGLVKELGISFLRFGPPYYKTHLGPGRYDWDFTDQTMAELKRLEITIIADLCHFGLPDWLGNFQNPEWPKHFADYAAAFAERYPWVKLYTPVNEIYVCANFSAQLGWWNERLKSDRSFVTALQNLIKANLLAEEQILRIHPTALFIQSESTEYFHPTDNQDMERSEFLNQRRFLSLDLCYGQDVSATMYEFLLEHGLSRDDYHWFRRHGARMKPHCVMGNDYYLSNENLVPTGHEDLLAAGEVFGYYLITKQYFDRYHLPVMHTETNFNSSDQAPQWLWKEWSNMIRLKQDGVPIVGFTWYSLIDQVDWDTALREENNRVNPRGLYGLDRQIKPAGEAYKKLVEQWKDIQPHDSFTPTWGSSSPENHRPRFS